MPPREELRGDSPSGLAANAPFRSALSCPFYPSLSEFVWRVLDRDAKRRACIVKHPPKCHLKFFKISALANSIAVEKFRILCYNVENNYWRMP